MTTRHRTRDAGSALMLALIAFVIMGGIAGAFFSLTLTSHKTTSNASNADGAFHVAEAGIDDVMNRMVALAAMYDPASPEVAKASEYWAVVDGTFTGNVNRGSYTVTIDPPIALDDSTEPYIVSNVHKVTSVGLFNGEERGIETYVVAGVYRPGFKAGLFGDVELDSGGNLITDGYKSKDGYKPTDKEIDGKTYQLQNDTGHIGSNGGVSVGGSAIIYGNATPGPGQTVTGDGYVSGSKTAATQYEDIGEVIYDASTAGAKFLDTTPTGDLAGGTYEISSLSLGSKDELTIKGHVVLYVQGDIKITAQAQVTIEKENASLTIIQQGGSIDIHGGSTTGTDGGVSNNSGIPSNLLIKSNATTVTVNGGADFYGAIRAPLAHLKLNGNADYFGGVIAKTIQATGTASFHYDEDLIDLGDPKATFTVKSTHQFVP